MTLDLTDFILLTLASIKVYVPPERYAPLSGILK